MVREKKRLLATFHPSSSRGIFQEFNHDLRAKSPSLLNRRFTVLSTGHEELHYHSNGFSADSS